MIVNQSTQADWSTNLQDQSPKMKRSPLSLHPGDSAAASGGGSNQGTLDHQLRNKDEEQPGNFIRREDEAKLGQTGWALKSVEPGP